MRRGKNTRKPPDATVQEGTQQQGTEPQQIKETNSGLIVGADPPEERLPTQVVNGQVQADTTGQPPPKDSTGRTFTAEDIERARKEEKDKLYARLETMDSEIKRMREEREAREKAEKEEQDRVTAEANRKAEEEMGLKELLAKKEQEWNQRFQDFEADRERERAVFEMERRLSALNDYRMQRMQEESEEILPELIDMVKGNSEEEIETSIATLKDRTQRILSQVQQATQQSRQQMRTASVTSPPVGPMDNETLLAENLSPADIKNMSMGEYAKHRDRLLGAISRQSNERGLYD